MADRSRLTRVGLGLGAVGLLGIALSSSANTGSDTSPLLLILLAAIARFILGLLVTGAALVPWSGRLRITGLVLLAGSRRAPSRRSRAHPIVSAVLYAGIPLGSDRAGR